MPKTPKKVANLLGQGINNNETESSIARNRKKTNTNGTLKKEIELPNFILNSNPPERFIEILLGIHSEYEKKDKCSLSIIDGICALIEDKESYFVGDFVEYKENIPAFLMVAFGRAKSTAYEDYKIANLVVNNNVTHYLRGSHPISKIRGIRSILLAIANLQTGMYSDGKYYGKEALLKLQKELLTKDLIAKFDDDTIEQLEKETKLQEFREKLSQMKAKALPPQNQLSDIKLKIEKKSNTMTIQAPTEGNGVEYMKNLKKLNAVIIEKISDPEVLKKLINSTQKQLNNVVEGKFGKSK